MVRGTFANIRLRNQLVEKVGGYTRHFPDGAETTIYDAAMSYAAEGVPLVVLAGKEYGSGSSRDWAAKGTKLLGVGAVIAESFERIHRSNLIGMGVIPLQYADGETAASLGLDRRRDDHDRRPRRRQRPKPSPSPPPPTPATSKTFEAKVRLDTPNEVTYINNGGILQTVLRNLKS